MEPLHLPRHILESVFLVCLHYSTTGESRKLEILLIVCTILRTSNFFIVSPQASFSYETHQAAQAQGPARISFHFPGA